MQPNSISKSKSREEVLIGAVIALSIAASCVAVGYYFGACPKKSANNKTKGGQSNKSNPEPKTPDQILKAAPHKSALEIGEIKGKILEK